MKPARKKPEIMSPAGYWPQVHAAIESGADAVYFGLKQFTARAKVGFDLEELPQVMQTLHRRGVKGYLTFNTLVFDNELRQAAETLTKVHDAGVDALIVQDWAIADLVHRYVPDLTVHGSTQMSITNAAGVRMAQSFGAQRVVLARELSLKEIEQICNETDCELEI
ncbi:MAG: U32 family peptidase, partial [Acidobacteria bacterium]|nr:U32 family peptidase [Acidobacteriota bacterium]